MADELSDAELAEIESLVAKTTPGPWKAFIEGRDHTSGESFIRVGPPDDVLDMYVTLHSGTTALPATDFDLDFIAGAKKQIPRLVAEVRRLKSS